MLRRIGEAILLVVILVAVGIVTRLGTTQPPITQTRSGHAKLFNPSILLQSRGRRALTERLHQGRTSNYMIQASSSLGVCLKQSQYYNHRLAQHRKKTCQTCAFESRSGAYYGRSRGRRTRKYRNTDIFPFTDCRLVATKQGTTVPKTVPI